MIHVTAIQQLRNEKEKEKNPAGGKKVDQAVLEKTHYSCPVYKYPKRNDKYLIFRVWLKPEGQGGSPNTNKGMTPPMKWKLCGVSLLCTKD